MWHPMAIFISHTTHYSLTVLLNREEIFSCLRNGPQSSEDKLKVLLGIQDILHPT